MIPARRNHSSFVAAIALLATPLLAFRYLTFIAPERDHRGGAPGALLCRFGGPLTAMLLAVLVGIALVRIREPQTLLVAIGFLAIAGVFSVHGLSTPGDQMMVKEMHHSLTISARLSLFLGSISFLLSSGEMPVRLHRAVARRHGSLLLAAVAVVGIYIGANRAKPDLLDFIPAGAGRSGAHP